MIQEGRNIDLQERDLRLVQQIVHDHLPGRSVFVFGSRVTGRARRCSDLDLAVVGEPLTLRQEALIEYAFQESNLPMTVDVISLEQATGVFRQRIEGELTPLPELSANRPQATERHVAA